MEKYFSKHDPKVGLLHMIIRVGEIKQGREDMIDPDRFLQLATLKLEKGTTFKPHRHVFKQPFPYKTITQESWVVIKGSVRCIFYDVNKEILAEPILKEGDASVTLYGGHNYEILEEGTIVYEFKTGPYFGQEKDKVFI